MRASTAKAIASVGLVAAVAVGVFASASFATRNVVTEGDELLDDDVPRMPSLHVRGGVKTVHKDGALHYALDFTATFIAQADGKEAILDGAVPQLAVEQAISFPTLSDRQDFVGPVGLPFESQTLALRVEMTGECFEPLGKRGHRLRGFDEKCTQARLVLGDQAFDVTDLFVDVDSTLKASGHDDQKWTWRTRAVFKDPGYPFPIASLGDGGSMAVMVGDMGAIADVGNVKFSGAG